MTDNLSADPVPSDPDGHETWDASDTMKRIYLIGGATVAVIAIAWFVVATFVFPSIGAVVKAAVEKIGSDLTQTTVSLDDVEISLSDGRGSFHGLRMTNPSGFADDDAFAFDEVTIVLDLASLTSDTIVIKEVTVKEPRILYELSDKGTNIEKIQRNVKTSQQSSASGGSDGNGRSFVIENLYLRDGTVSVAASGLVDRKLTVPLPDVHLTDVGRDSGGASPGDIVEQTLAAIGNGITTAVADINLDAITQGIQYTAEGAGRALGSAAESAGDVAGEAGNAVVEGAEKAGEAIGEGAEEAGKAIKSLFNN